MMTDRGIPSFLSTSEFALLGFRIPSHHLAGAGAGLCALYAALVLGLILYSFRKTVSAEIYFFSYWVLSLGFEILRLVVFSLAADDIAATWQILATKALLFSRYSGQLALFASGLYAAGLRNEKLGTVTALVLAPAFALAATMPINTGSFAPTLELFPGYGDLNEAFFVFLAVATVLNFLYASRVSGEKSYRVVAAGALLFLVGQRLLVTQWNPFMMVLGFSLLAGGSWLFVSRLHSYYLWQ
jgi:hypothetical protein